MEHIRVVSQGDKGKFTEEVNIWMRQGYKVSSTHCMTFEECGSEAWQAILVHPGLQEEKL